MTIHFLTPRFPIINLRDVHSSRNLPLASQAARPACRHKVNSGVIQKRGKSTHVLLEAAQAVDRAVLPFRCAGIGPPLQLSYPEKDAYRQHNSITKVIPLFGDEQNITRSLAAFFVEVAKATPFPRLRLPAASTPTREISPQLLLASVSHAGIT